jgi:hypothetical protein
VNPVNWTVFFIAFCVTYAILYALILWRIR